MERRLKWDTKQDTSNCNKALFISESSLHSEIPSSTFELVNALFTVAQSWSLYMTVPLGTSPKG
jgi:hypothetical protein